MEEILKKPRVNPEDYIDGSHRPFKKGNPGRPKGCKNKDTVAREAIIDAFLNRRIELTSLEFKKLIDAVVTLLPKKIQGEGIGDRYTMIWNYLAEKSKEVNEAGRVRV